MLSTELEKEIKTKNISEENKNHMENEKEKQQSQEDLKEGESENQEKEDIPSNPKLKENVQSTQKKTGVSKVCIAVIVLVVLFRLFGGKGDKEEYLNNAGDKVPIKIEYMSVLNSYYNYATISFRGLNNSGKDLRSITYGITAWDSNKMPVVLDDYSDDDGYLFLCTSSNLAADGVDAKEINIGNKEIRYIQQIVWEYEDYDGKKWRNPSQKLYKKEYAGEKLKTDSMNFIELDTESEAYLQGILHEGVVNLGDEMGSAGDDILDVDNLIYIDDGKNVRNGILIDEEGNPILDINGDPVRDIHIYERCTYDEFRYAFKEYDGRSLTIDDCIFTYQSGRIGMLLDNVFVCLIPTKSFYREIGSLEDIWGEGDMGNISGTFSLNKGGTPYIAIDSVEVW